MNRLKKVCCVAALFVMTMGCAVSSSDYTAYFIKPENGLRKEILSKGSNLIIQYLSSELKALSEFGDQDQLDFKKRVEELDKFVLFELVVEGSNPAVYDYAKTSLEYDIALDLQGNKQSPVFYHVEHNPLQASKKIQVYFSKPDVEIDYHLTIAKSKWLDETQFTVEQKNILQSPHLNL